MGSDQHFLEVCSGPTGRRRAFLVAAIACLGAPFSAAAQPAKGVRRVGVLHSGSSREASSIQREPFERGLRELGWQPGKDLLIDYRYAEGDSVRLPQLARELAGAGAEVIIARGNAAVDAARRTTSTVPIVMSGWAGDPAAAGIVKSWGRPGGNVTGFAGDAFALDGKRLQLLKDAFPGITRVAVIANPKFDPGRYDRQIARLLNDAASLKLRLEIFGISHPGEVASAFEKIERGRFDALLVRADPLVLDPARREITRLAAGQRLPAIYAWRFFAEAGGLMSYAADISAQHHRSASYVSRILKGTSPGELPVEQATQFDLTINLRTAKAMGIDMPKPVLFQATQLIE